MLSGIIPSVAKKPGDFLFVENAPLHDMWYVAIFQLQMVVSVATFSYPQFKIHCLYVFQARKTVYFQMHQTYDIRQTKI